MSIERDANIKFHELGTRDLIKLGHYLLSVLLGRKKLRMRYWRGRAPLLSRS